MASGPLGPGGGGDGHRWAENKVYTRKAHRIRSKPNPNSHPQPQSQPPQSTELVNSSLHPSTDEPSSLCYLRKVSANVPSTKSHTNCEADVPLVSHITENGEPHRLINLGASMLSPEAKDLRRKLSEELQQIRGLLKKLDARAHGTPPVPVVTTVNSQLLSENDGVPIVPPERQMVNSESDAAVVINSVLVAAGHVENLSMNDTFEKEKRTPKANQYYKNSDFITGKDRLPTADPHKKSKANGGKKNVDVVSSGVDKLHTQAFKSCLTLLTRLMKHKHGWVFNTPVDAKDLGLYDYHLIIKHPMDLGTVKSRLDTNWYKSPQEFAEDVKLTFRNAMMYNPEGQDVHIMAEQLLKVFEDKWPTIEAEFSSPAYSTMSRKARPPPLDTRRILERSDSTLHSVRTPALKKPKAKDLHKREMTFEEKQKLSNNLQNLPSEKLDIVVQIIKKKNLSMSQHDDEIEVDIDSVDTETLWELDRFVTNYKKSLSKHKRKAELAIQAKQEAEKARQLQNQAVVVSEVPLEGKIDEKDAGNTSPIGDREKGDNGSLSSSSRSSSGDSGSSSSDSDSESSSS